MRNHFIWAEMSYVTTERKVVMFVSLKKKRSYFPLTSAEFVANQ